MKNKILIIGAGPAGLTCGYQISKNHNYDCKIIEITDQVGGMARSITIFDRIVDIGPHRFFSNDTRINKLWLEVIGSEYKMVNRLTRIYYKKNYIEEIGLRAFEGYEDIGLVQKIWINLLKRNQRPILNLKITKWMKFLFLEKLLQSLR